MWAYRVIARQIDFQLLGFTIPESLGDREVVRLVSETIALQRVGVQVVLLQAWRHFICRRTRGRLLQRGGDRDCRERHRARVQQGQKMQRWHCVCCWLWQLVCCVTHTVWAREKALMKGRHQCLARSAPAVAAQH